MMEGSLSGHVGYSGGREGDRCHPDGRGAQYRGGLGSAVAEVLVDEDRVPFVRHGLQDCFALVGPPAALYAHYKLDAPGIAETARGLLRAAA